MKDFVLENHADPNPGSRETVLSDDAWNRLQEVIENPKQPTKAMKSLMSEDRLKKGNRIL